MGLIDIILTFNILWYEVSTVTINKNTNHDSFNLLFYSKYALIIILLLFTIPNVIVSIKNKKLNKHIVTYLFVIIFLGMITFGYFSYLESFIQLDNIFHKIV